MARTEDAILAVPMGNVGIRIKDIHRQRVSEVRAPGRARVLELQSVGYLGLAPYTRYKYWFESSDRRVGRPGQASGREEGVGGCPVIGGLIIVETGSQ